MKPLVLEYLRSHTFRELEDEHGVCARPNSRFDKFSLNYDQILAKSGNALMEQCRGMVIRPSREQTEQFLHDEARRGGAPLSTAKWRDRVVGDCELLAWPMNRFYNHGDVAAAGVDWSDPELRVYEKLDGTCCIVYWDELHGQWHVGTRSVPEADLPIRKDDMSIGNMTFRDLFFKALIETREANSGQKLDWVPSDFDQVVHLNKELTYVFELTSPHNRIVVRYDEPRVTLLAIRHTASGNESVIEELQLQHVNRPQRWKLSEPKALAAFVEAADPSKLEGAVVVDSNFNRQKVKSRAWVLSSKAKDLVTVSKRSAVEAIIRGTIDDVIPLVEADVAGELRSMQAAVREYLISVDRNFEAWRDYAAGSRKLFAEKVMQSNDWAAPYFNLWESRAANAREWCELMASKEKLNASSYDTILNKIGR
jgi:hypothetical protein